MIDLTEHPMRNLLGRLHDRSPHDLDLIARWWEVRPRGRDHHAIAGQLYRVLIDPWAFALAWERLSPTDRVVLELLGEQEEPHPPEEIAAGLEAPVGSVIPGLRRLYRAGYLFVQQERPEEERRFYLPRETAGLTSRLRAEQERGLPVSEGAAKLLDRLTDGALADIAEGMGRQVIPVLALRPDLVSFLTPRLGDPEVVQSSVAGLQPGARRLWDWLLEQPEPPSPEAARGALEMSGADLRAAAWRLARAGLLWRGYVEDGTLRLVVPELVRRPRAQPSRPLPQLVMVEPGGVEPVDWVPEYAVAWDLLTTLRLVSDGVRDLEDGPVLRRLSTALWRRGGDVPPTGYVPFLRMLGAGLGLLDARGIDRERLRRWVRREFAEQAQQIVALWMGLSDWPEGAGREALQVWGADWPGFRRRLGEALTALAPGEWLTLSSFTARFAAELPGALGASFTAAGATEPEEDVSADPEARRRGVVQQAATLTLTTACHWLGLIEMSRARREAVFCLTPQGAALLDPTRPMPEPETLGDRPLTVQATFEVLLLQPSPRRVWALTAFSDLVALDRVSSYRLTRQSVERGLSGGISLAQLAGFLERQAGEALPQNVAFELEQWTREFRRVRLRPSLLLEPDDRASSHAIADGLRAAGMQIEPLPDGRLLVAVADGDLAGALQRLEERLRGLGHTPLQQS